MLVNSQVKYIQSLGHKKFRDADGVFVAEGPKIVLELLQSEHCRLVHCFATAGWIRMHDELFKGREQHIVEIGEKELERISMLVTPNQVLAVFTKPVFGSAQKTGGPVLLLDTIQDPGNMGTIIRTADWFGVERMVCSPETADVFNPKVIQAAMGSIIRVEVIYADLAEYILANPGIPVYASSLEGEDLGENIHVTNAMILLGNESKGIRPELESLASRKIRIPSRGGAESLNVAIAAGILLSRFEWVTQKLSL